MFLIQILTHLSDASCLKSHGLGIMAEIISLVSEFDSIKVNKFS